MAPGDKQYILVVDDDDLVRSGLATDLRSLGFEVGTADSGAACLGRVTENHVDLVLLDIVMDGQDGITTLKKLRELNQDLPVIINTAYGSLQIAMEAMRYGASDLLLKPSQSEEIAHRIQQVLKGEELRKRALAAESFESKLDSLQTLAGGIAHDLNNQLTVIISNVGELIRKPQDQQTAQSDLGEVLDCATKISKLSHKLLAYAGGGHFEMETLDLAGYVPEIVKRLVQRLKPQVQHAARLNLHVEGQTIPVQADRKELDLVLEHLLTNAFESLTGRDNSIEVEVKPRIIDQAFIDEHVSLKRLQPGEYACVRITDNGCGMDPLTLENVFDPFFSTKFTGRGLGLPSAQGILTGHGGAILVRSMEKEGTSAEILLPLVPEADPSKPPLPHTNIEFPLGEEVQDRQLDAARSGNILIIDDETMVRKLAEKALVRSGHFVQSYSNGIEGLEKFGEDPAAIDLVVLDLCMPEMDGQEVLAELRKIRKDVKVLLTSGYHSSEVANRFEDTKPDGFLAKPYPIHELREKVSALLQA